MIIRTARVYRLPVLAGLLAVGLLAIALPAAAQQHRATRLGNPATRFADPLETPADLRRTLLSERLHADVLTILDLSGYRGTWEDFRRAVNEAAITELQIAPGTRLSAMSSREKGKAVLLRDLLWAGKEPFAAYEFFLSSQGRRYRVVTPKPCSNFWVEDMGKEVVAKRPSLEVVTTAPAEGSACSPMRMEVVLRNNGNTPLSQVQGTEALPAGMLTAAGAKTLSYKAGALQPGEGLAFTFSVQAARGGTYSRQVSATAAEGVAAQATASTLVHSPSLALTCKTPDSAFLGKPVEVCLTVKNSGDAPEAAAVVTLPIPAGATFISGTVAVTEEKESLVWHLPALEPSAATELCATFTAAEPGNLLFSPAVQGACAAPAASQCATRVTGIPAVLLEVIDLEDPLPVGQDGTYVITVTNQGSADLTNVKLLCTLEDTQAHVPSNAAPAASVPQRTVVMEPLATLAPKQHATWKVVVKALSAGDVRFAIALECDQLKQPVRETEATYQY